MDVERLLAAARDLGWAVVGFLFTGIVAVLVFVVLWRAFGS